MEQGLTEEEMVTSVKKSSKRRGPGRRKDFVQENIAFLRKLQDTLREKKSEATAVVRTRRKAQNHKSSKLGATHTNRKQHAQTGKHSARKEKSSPKFQPYVTDDNVGNLDIKLSAEEKLLLRGYDSYASTSNTDLLSTVSSTDNETEIVEAPVEDETDVATQLHSVTSKISEGNKSHRSIEGQEAVRGTDSSKTLASVKQNSTSSPSGEDVTVSSLHRIFSTAKQPSVKMTAKAMAARQKLLTSSTADPTKAPPSYKRGVVPRYLRTYKKEQQKADEEELFDLQQGYVPLPDDTRKEVLMLLRNSFADFAHQLNMLPLRPPNLEIRERRTDIEKQLDKLEEAIQVFSQSEVSVKVTLHKKSVKSV